MINVGSYKCFFEKGSLTKLSNLKTVAHEMGHNIGLQHDCINYNCAHWSDYYVGPRVIDGVECYGYMDYKDDTNYWSPCSVSDLLTYINSLPSGFCLESLGKGNFNSKTLLHIIIKYNTHSLFAELYH